MHAYIMVIFYETIAVNHSLVHVIISLITVFVFLFAFLLEPLEKVLCWLLPK